MNTEFHKLLNRALDELAYPKIRVFHRDRPAFRVFGYIGLALAILLAMGLVSYRGLSPWVAAGIVLAAVLTFFGLVMITKIITGEERIINYQHQITVMVVAAVLLWLLGQPILPYLDVTILGVGIFLVCGRIGCFMVGCCHGRPSSFGVCYRQEHADAGFTPYFVGVRLFPIQVVESLWLFCIVLAGATFVLRGHQPGEALAWYVVTYDLGRFGFEFLRGDPDRPYYRGFSQPQWISLVLMLAVVWAEMAGMLPFRAWHFGGTVFVALAMIAVSLKRRRQKNAKYQLFHPRHVKEVAEAVEQVSNLASERTSITERDSVPTDICLGATSLGVQISGSRIRSVAGDIRHYALSCRNGSLTAEAAGDLAALILKLTRLSGSSELVEGSRGVFHLLIRPLSSCIVRKALVIGRQRQNRLFCRERQDEHPRRRKFEKPA
jgi:hypothetical protein